MALKLSQPELGILYVETQAPMGVQQCLLHQQLHDQDKITLHQIISGQQPDVALISLGLCGVVLANHLFEREGVETGTELAALVTEMKHIAVNAAEDYGRLWINAAEHEKRETEDNELALLEEAPEILNALGSVLEELQDEFETPEYVHEIIKMLTYQSYAQADLAEQYLDLIAAKRTPHGDPIPLPLELQE